MASFTAHQLQNCLDWKTPLGITAVQALAQAGTTRKIARTVPNTLSALTHKTEKSREKKIFNSHKYVNVYKPWHKRSQKPKDRWPSTLQSFSSKCIRKQPPVNEDHPVLHLGSSALAPALPLVRITTPSVPDRNKLTSPCISFLIHLSKYSWCKITRWYLRKT